MPELESKKTTGLTALGALWVIAAAWSLLQPQTLQATTQTTAQEKLT